MKGLLQSKRFKKNLSKWLCMYVGVLLLLTTVITYSKYISSFMGKDEARAAKFKVNSTGCTFDTTKESCDSGVYLRTDKITYYFGVDTREIEATAEFVLTVAIDSHFKLERIVKNGSALCDNNSENICKVNSKNLISLLDNQVDKEDILAGQGNLTSYEVTVSYNGNDEDFASNAYQAQNYQIVTLGYSAIQKN